MKPLQTRSDCPVCGQAVTAELRQKGGDLFMVKTCPQHGTVEVPFWKNAELYRQAHSLRHPDLLPEGPLDLAADAGQGFVTTYAIDVTTRCNMKCPTCVTAAEPDSEDDFTAEQLLSWVPEVRPDRRGFRPNISLVGGESTLREDLPQIIRGLIAKGLVPRLNSNGLLLREKDRLDRLWEAGLRWVILQFDGFEPQSSIAFRGKDYSGLKLEVIQALSQRGFAVHLAVMVQKGVNDHEIGRILRFAAEQPNVLRLSFYPRSWIGRFEDEHEGPTHVSDVIGCIQEQTGGQITERDILDSKRVGRRLFRLTGHPMFRQRVCIFPFLLMRTGDRLLPVSRLFRVPGMLAHLPQAWKLVRYARSLFNYDERAFGASFLFVNIEKFYDREAFDLDQARNCHHVYLSAKGAYPFCIYNTFEREIAGDGKESADTVRGITC